MTGSEFDFHYVHLLYYKCRKINPNYGGSYIRFSWLDTKQKKITQCNYRLKKKDPQRTTKIKPFINKYNWEGIHFPSEKDDWKKFEHNNVSIRLIIMYAEK